MVFSILTHIPTVISGYASVPATDDFYAEISYPRLWIFVRFPGSAIYVKLFQMQSVTQFKRYAVMLTTGKLFLILFLFWEPHPDDSQNVSF